MLRWVASRQQQLRIICSPSKSAAAGGDFLQLSNAYHVYYFKGTPPLFSQDGGPIFELFLLVGLL